MGFLRCPRCNLVPCYWDESDYERIRVCLDMDLNCPSCGTELRTVPGEAPFLNQFGYPQKDAPEVETSMPLKRENFNAVITELVKAGFEKDVPEAELRKSISKACDVVDVRTISTVVTSMRDLGMIRHKAFKLWEIVEEVES